MNEFKIFDSLATKNRQFLKIFLLCLISFGAGMIKNNYTFMFDDQVAVLKNTDVTNTTRSLFDSLGQIMRHDFWGQDLTNKNSHKSYRPLVSIMYHLEFRFFNLRSIASSMRRVNFIFHFGVCCALNNVLRRILTNCHESVTSITVMLFAIHPINTESICSIVGRADLLCAFIFLCTVYHYWEMIKAPNGINDGVMDIKMVIMLILSLMCMFSKEIGLAVLPLCAVLDIITHLKIPKIRKSDRARRFDILLDASRDLVMRISYLATIMGVLIFFRMLALNYQFPKFAPAENPVSNHPSFFVRLFTYQYIHAIHFWLMICPDWLCFDWSNGSIKFIESTSDQRIIFGILLYIFLTVCFVLGPRPVRIAVAFIVFPFIPASNLFPIGFVVAERVLYIPTMGYCLLLSLGFHNLYSRCVSPYLSTATEVFLFLAGMVLVLRSNQRIADWDNEFSLYFSGIRVNPYNSKIYYNLGAICLHSGDFENAYQFTNLANLLEPNQPNTLNNLANACRHLEKHDEAIRHFLKALTIDPTYSVAWMNLAISYAEIEVYDAAMEAYNNAKQLDPNNERVIYNLGNLYIRMGNYSMAGEMFKKSVEMNPRNYRSQINYLVHLSEHGTLEELLTACANAEFYAFHQIPVLMTVAEVLAKINYDFDRIESLYLRIMRLDPKYKRAYSKLGFEYKRRGNTRAALRCFKKAIDLDSEASDDINYIDLTQQLKDEKLKKDEIRRTKLEELTNKT